jgi:hypothetical protein
VEWLLSRFDTDQTEEPLASGTLLLGLNRPSSMLVLGHASTHVGIPRITPPIGQCWKVYLGFRTPGSYFRRRNSPNKCLVLRSAQVKASAKTTRTTITVLMSLPPIVKSLRHEPRRCVLRPIGSHHSAIVPMLHCVDGSSVYSVDQIERPVPSPVTDLQMCAMQSTHVRIQQVHR